MPTADAILDGFSLPDIVLPSQHFDARTKHLEPEKQLMFAVLIDAIRCFRMGSACGQGPRRRLFADSERWLFRAEGNGPFSLQNICDELEIDLCRLRRGVLHWRDRELAGEASRMIRRPPVLPVKQASGNAATSRREKNKGINSAKAG
jgi:hypothetical protein